ncbi:MAG: aldehyde dehydrogenase family protein [Bacteroidota bacterium]|jgi:acyl-CoA reductase-like NAD-dependent aldehyde dehydrogenase
MKAFPIYSGGNFIKTSVNLPVRNPYTKEIFAETYLCDENNLEESIKAAESVKKEIRDLPSWKKSQILYTIAEQLKCRKQYHAEILSKESAKPLKYAHIEVERAIQTFLIASEECKRLPKEYLSMDWTPAGNKREGLVQYFPSGIIAGISPFNFPLNLAVHKIAPAIAAGCPIILKPASSTPLSTLLLAEIIDETELPKGALSVLPMSREVGNTLVTDERFSLLSFTGSPEVGWEMKKNAGKKKTVLELGGNAGLIVSSNVSNWDENKKSNLIKRCIAGGFAYSGQICIHAQRFFIHEDLFDWFVNSLITQTKQLQVGDPLIEITEFSCMIDDANAERVELWVQEAVSSGATLLYGGKRTGNFLEPTILTGTSKNMKVNCEEVFGPVVVIEKFKSINQAVEMVNDSKFGLQCGIFTDSIAEMDYCFREIEAGGIIMNDAPSIRFDHMPYGGIKDSGLGREGVKYAIAEMMEARILLK